MKKNIHLHSFKNMVKGIVSNQRKISRRYIGSKTNPQETRRICDRKICKDCESVILAG